MHWHRYYFDGAGDGRRERSGISRGLHSFLNYPENGTEEFNASRENAWLSRWQPNAKILPPLAITYCARRLVPYISLPRVHRDVSMGLSGDLWSAEIDGSQGIYAVRMDPTGWELPDNDLGGQAPRVFLRRFEKSALEQAALAEYCRSLAKPRRSIPSDEFRPTFESWN